MSKSIVLYLHVHQPYRVRHYTIFDAGQHHDYFDAPLDAKESNEAVIRKVAGKSYLPTNQLLLELLNKYPGFKLSLSITGTIIEQLEEWAPDVLDSFKALTDTGRVEIVAETYHHSLAFFYSREEFERQVELHAHKIQQVFNQTPKVFRNTELAYNNQLAQWADEAGYKGILAEGWDPVLGWRSPNFVYRPADTKNVRLLMKNYKLSDDIAFRFGNKAWEEYPLSADKYAHWLSEAGDATNFNLFMDYETFGEHQWEDTGIFDFLRNLPEEWLKEENHDFKTVSEVIDTNEPKDSVDMPDTVTWADTERDLTAWLGNKMQQEASDAIYGLEAAVFECNDPVLVADWRKLTTSDHFYYMCTKWFNDGDVHAYFSPYDTPYEAFINFMNAWHDIRYRLGEKA
ncbi:MAG: glycoside hydrolase family 57 protein [Candidatus Saccharimonadales bacterium]